jgi:hypothetical protein
VNQGDFSIAGGSTPTSAPGTNLAFKKPCIASGIDDTSRTCGKAFDGDFATRWSSNWVDSASIYVDLGQVLLIEKVVIHWEAAYATGFQIQVANNATYADANGWTNVYANYNGQGGVTSIPLSNVNARYVKMYSFKRATQYGVSIFEMEVY